MVRSFLTSYLRTSPNIVQLVLPWADLDPKAEMCPSVGWKRHFMGPFWLNCAQMAPEAAESDF